MQRLKTYLLKTKRLWHLILLSLNLYDPEGKKRKSKKANTTLQVFQIEFKKQILSLLFNSFSKS